MDLLRFYEQQVEEQLYELEDNIYHLESRYLEEDPQLGNILQGFESLSDGRVPGSRRGTSSGSVSTKDRIFSNSSCTAPHRRESLMEDSPGLFGKSAVDYVLEATSAPHTGEGNDSESCVL